MRNNVSLFHAIDFTPSVLVLLGGVLIALQLALPAVAFASPTRSAAPNPPADQAFALAEVSVVRLAVSYSSTAQPVGGQPVVPSVECTGLGVLVASWATTNPREENTWVLTDGDLVNKNVASCAGSTSAEQIATLQVYANNVYTSNPQGLLLSSPGFVPVNVLCSDTKICSSGAVLFAFHTDQPQPFLDVASLTTSQSTPFGIELTKDGSPSAIPRHRMLSHNKQPSICNRCPSSLLLPKRLPAAPCRIQPRSSWARLWWVVVAAWQAYSSMPTAFFLQSISHSFWLPSQNSRLHRRIQTP